MRARIALCGALALTVLLMSGCYREKRQFESPPEVSRVLDTVRLGDLQPGESKGGTPTPNAYEENAYAVAQGKRLFRWYNCNGCHGQGGGNIGPALMDGKWIYGSEPQQVFATISQGRPNGMPSFRGHVTDDQIWQLVAYVRSMSGQVRSDVAPSRNDGLKGAPPENTRNPEPPTGGELPGASKQ